MKKYILGIAAFNHDASACLITEDGRITFVEEERLNKEKHTSAFPIRSINLLCNKEGISLNDITHISFYFSPRLLWRQYLEKNNPISLFLTPKRFLSKKYYFELVWLLSFINKVNSIKRYFGNSVEYAYYTHHTCHVMYGIFDAPFSKGIVISNDSMGEKESSYIVTFDKNKQKIWKKLSSQQDPHSIGYLYGAVTEYFNFKRGGDEGKVMALASFYNKPKNDVSFFKKNVSLLEKGNFKLNSRLLRERSFRPKGIRLGKDFIKLYGERKSMGDFSEQDYKIAYELQSITEKILNHQVKYATKYFNKIVITGGVAQNSVANGSLANNFPTTQFHVPPIPHDAGTSIGAALITFHKLYAKLPNYDGTVHLYNMNTDIPESLIEKLLKSHKVHYEKKVVTPEFVGELLIKGKVVGVFRDKMESGPRALGYRSILALPTMKIKDYINKEVKYRESFRPYGGIIQDSDLTDVFKVKSQYYDYPYMTHVFYVKPQWIKKLGALVHVDGSCRIQTVSTKQDKWMYDLIDTLKKKKGIPMVLNTSFNLKGEPIVYSLDQALGTFFTSGMDYLIINNMYLIKK